MVKPPHVQIDQIINTRTGEKLWAFVVQPDESDDEFSEPFGMVDEDLLTLMERAIEIMKLYDGDLRVMLGKHAAYLDVIVPWRKSDQN